LKLSGSRFRVACFPNFFLAVRRLRDGFFGFRDRAGESTEIVRDTKRETKFSAASTFSVFIIQSVNLNRLIPQPVLSKVYFEERAAPAPAV
jgi:hypothetical protein